MQPEADPRTRVRWRETWIALALALLLGVLAVGAPVWNGDAVYLATDTASVQAPWSSAPAARNVELSDSGVAFYPQYVSVARRWRSGELPLWNPDLYAGVPQLAAAQWGVLDPQVLVLVALDALGGRALFDRGFAWLAALRIALAALGTYLLARRLGLGAPAAALAAGGYATSGSIVLWLGFSLAHVTPLLPWVLFGVEGLRGARPLRGFLIAAVALALAIYGGHPEVAFFVGLAGGVWSLTLRDAGLARLRLAWLALLTGTLLAAPVLVPFLEYLKHSGALVAHQLAPSARARPDLIALGALLGFLAVARLWRAEFGDEAGRKGLLFAALPFAFVGGTLLLFLVARGADFELGLQQARALEPASTRLAFPLLVLAFAATLDGPGGPWRSRAWMGAVAWAVAAELPGVVDLWRWLPLVGLAAPARAACVAALLLALLAGRGFESARPAARWAAACALLAFAALALSRDHAERTSPVAFALDRSDAVVTFEELPAARGAATSSSLSGVVRGGLQADEVRLTCETPTGASAPFVRIARLLGGLARGEQRFDFGELDVSGLGPGDWVLRVDFVRDGAVLGSRRPALIRNSGRGPLDPWGVGLGLLALGLVLAPRRRVTDALLVGLVAASGVLLTHTWNPAVPLEEHLSRSRTEAFLAERFTGERVLAGPGVLPGNTALLAGLTTLDGYDALDVASFDGYRAFALQPGRNPLLDWNADGVALDSAAFRLFGVRALLFSGPRTLEGWTLVAGPEGAPADAEVYVYAADAPLPRAFCVPRVSTKASVMERLASFDPSAEAFVEGEVELEIDSPFEEARVTEVARGPERVEYLVELDGEGLFVLTDQHFPGWELEVDRAPREILRTNSIFRGAFLTPGEHRLVFSYRPSSWRLGLALGAAGLALLAVCCVLATRRS